MKIAIFTIIGRGPGTKLQNYALQFFLEKNYEADVKTIRRDSYFYERLSWKNLYGINSWKKLIKFIINYKGYRKWLFNEVEVQDSWLDFDRNIHYTEEIEKNNDGPISKEFRSKFDYFIVGSDQVWNPNWYHNIDYFKYVDYKKQIAYAASFGVYTIPLNLEKHFREVLSKIKNISVREEAGQKIVKDLINKDVPIVLDPTMLLMKDEWLKIAKKPNWKQDNKYICAFFLGNISKNKKEKIEKIAKMINAQVIYPLKNFDEFGKKIGPAEFIYLINNSEYIFTDSFHGTVFSIIMKKLFLVFDREENGQCNMNSRLDTLLGMLNLKYRHVQDNTELILDLLKKEIDYTNIDVILSKKRNEAKNFFDMVFGIVKE